MPRITKSKFRYYKFKKLRTDLTVLKCLNYGKETYFNGRYPIFDSVTKTYPETTMNRNNMNMKLCNPSHCPSGPGLSFSPCLTD